METPKEKILITHSSWCSKSTEIGLKYVWWCGEDSTGQCWTAVNTVMNISEPDKVDNFLISWLTISSWRKMFSGVSQCGAKCWENIWCKMLRKHLVQNVEETFGAKCWGNIWCKTWRKHLVQNVEETFGAKCWGNIWCKMLRKHLVQNVEETFGAKRFIVYWLTHCNSLPLWNWWHGNSILIGFQCQHYRTERLHCTVTTTALAVKSHITVLNRLAILCCIHCRFYRTSVIS